MLTFDCDRLYAAQTHRSQSVWPESAPHPPGFVQQPSPSAHSGTSASASTTSSAGRGTFPVPRRRSRAGSRAAQHLFAPISTVLSTGRGGQPSIGSAPPSMQAFASGSDTGNVAYSGLTAGVSSSSVSPVGLGPRTAGAVSGPADGGMRQGSERFRQALDGFSRVKDGR